MLKKKLESYGFEGRGIGTVYSVVPDLAKRIILFFTRSM